MAAIVERQWSSMRPGDFVYDKTGKAWKIASRGTLGDIVLVDEAGQQVNIGKQSGPVSWWDGSPEAEALEGFRMALGARILYDRH